jgi:hypothetical protein
MKTNKYKEIAQLLSSHKQRKRGKTTAICYGAKAIDATVICDNNYQSRIISDKFNVATVRINDLDSLRGSNKPFLLEHYVIETLLNEAGNRIIELEKEIEDLKKDKTENVAELPNGIIISFSTF